MRPVLGLRERERTGARESQRERRQSRGFEGGDIRHTTINGLILVDPEQDCVPPRLALAA